MWLKFLERALLPSKQSRIRLPTPSHAHICAIFSVKADLAFPIREEGNYRVPASAGSYPAVD